MHRRHFLLIPKSPNLKGQGPKPTSRDSGREPTAREHATLSVSTFCNTSGTYAPHYCEIIALHVGLVQPARVVACGKFVGPTTGLTNSFRFGRIGSKCSNSLYVDVAKNVRPLGWKGAFVGRFGLNSALLQPAPVPASRATRGGGGLSDQASLVVGSRYWASVAGCAPLPRGGKDATGAEASSDRAAISH